MVRLLCGRSSSGISADDGGPVMTRATRAILAVGVALAIVVAALVFWPKAPQRSLSAIFPSAVGVHPGSDVRVLGVKVGEVISVKPQGRTVLVQMRYDASLKVPAD